MSTSRAKHLARRTAARAEPSPITGLRDMLATALAADVAAVTPMVCDIMRDCKPIDMPLARRRLLEGARDRWGGTVLGVFVADE